MPSASTYFLVAAALFGLGAVGLGSGMILADRCPGGNRPGVLSQWVQRLGAGALLFGTGFFAMAFALTLRIKFQW